MITVPAAAIGSISAIKNWLRHYAFHEMQQIAEGWGLDDSCPEPDSDTPAKVNIRFSSQSRRKLLRFH